MKAFIAEINKDKKLRRLILQIVLLILFIVMMQSGLYLLKNQLSTRSSVSMYGERWFDSVDGYAKKCSGGLNHVRINFPDTNEQVVLEFQNEKLVKTDGTFVTAIGTYEVLTIRTRQRVLNFITVERYLYIQNCGAGMKLKNQNVFSITK